MTLTATANVLSDPRLVFSHETIKSINAEDALSKSSIRDELSLQNIIIPSITKEDYFTMLLTYARAHKRIIENGEIGWKEGNTKTVSWLDENLDPFTGMMMPYFTYYHHFVKSMIMFYVLIFVV